MMMIIIIIDWQCRLCVCVCLSECLQIIFYTVIIAVDDVVDCIQFLGMNKQNRAASSGNVNRQDSIEGRESWHICAHTCVYTRTSNKQIYKVTFYESRRKQ